MSDHPDGPRSSPSITPFIIQIPATIRQEQLPPHVKFCPRTRSIMAYNPATRLHKIIPLRCKCWSCPVCGPRRAANIFFRLQKGLPQRLITLTSKALPTDTPTSLFKRIRPMVSRLMQEARRRFGPCAYACLLETTLRGFPHFHILQRGCYIPQAWLSKTWARMTGAKIVDIRQIRDAAGTAKYVCKYLLKTALNAASHHLGRVISMSADYLIGDRVIPNPEKWLYTVLPKHPLELLASWPCPRTVTITSDLILFHPHSLVSYYNSLLGFPSSNTS